MSLNCNRGRCNGRPCTGRWKGKGGERREKAEGREMLDNGIKLGLRDINTELGIALLRGDHRYVRLYDCAIVATLVVLSR